MAKYHVGDRVNAHGFSGVVKHIIYKGSPKNNGLNGEVFELDHYFIEFDNPNEEPHYVTEQRMKSI